MTDQLELANYSIKPLIYHLILFLFKDINSLLARNKKNLDKNMKEKQLKFSIKIVPEQCISNFKILRF